MCIFDTLMESEGNCDEKMMLSFVIYVQVSIQSSEVQRLKQKLADKENELSEKYAFLLLKLMCDVLL